MAVILLAIAALAAGDSFFTRPVARLTEELNRRGDVGGRIDPNVAPWWELSHLPGIGEIKAKGIVEYRERVRAGGVGPDHTTTFRTPSDLAKVKGIGARTVARLAPFLDLPQPESGIVPETSLDGGTGPRSSASRG